MYNVSAVCYKQYLPSVCQSVSQSLFVESVWTVYVAVPDLLKSPWEQDSHNVPTTNHRILTLEKPHTVVVQPYVSGSILRNQGITNVKNFNYLNY